MRIGGDLELTIEQLSVTSLAKQKATLKGPQVRRDSLCLDTGRSALYVALQDILARNGKRTAYLPAYTCHSVIHAFLQCGFNIRFYSMGDDLASPSNLPDKLDSETFLFIHYFGIVNRSIVKWLTAMGKDRTFFVIEDAVQALLTADTLSHGDYAINSFRKFFPLPDGATLYSREPLIGIECSEADEGFVCRRLLAKLLRHHTADNPAFLGLLHEAEHIIEQKITPRKMSWISQYLLEGIDTPAVAQKRRQNWSTLRRLFARMPLGEHNLKPLFTTLTDSEVPLGMPVIIGNGKRDQLRQYLYSKNIFCAVHWPLQERLYQAQDLRAEMRLSNSILTLPIDQRLKAAHLEHMYSEICNFYKHYD